MGTRNDGIQPPKNTRWYKFIQWLIRKTVAEFGYMYLDVRTDRYTDELKGGYIIAHNHVCDFDFIGIYRGVPRYQRFIASDALVKKPLPRLLFNIAADFMFRRKGENADDIVDSIKLTIAEGTNVQIAVEGQEAPSGMTQVVRKRTGRMMKEMPEANLLTYRMEGGYFKFPVWADHTARGPMFGRVMGIYTKDQLAGMTAQEINDLIAEDIKINHYEWQREHMIPYKRKNPAQCMERTLFTCPKCEKIGTLHSHGDTLECSDCGYSLKVNDYGFYEGEEVIFDNMYDWDVWQRDRMRKLIPYYSEHRDETIVSDDDMSLRTPVDGYPKVLDDHVDVRMTYDSLIIKGENTDMVMPFSEITGIAMSSKEVFGVSYHDVYYQLKSRIPVCVRKYRTVYKLIVGGDDY